jgi:tripartite-type tricarboxylate transporter receptor subunit TctC
LERLEQLERVKGGNMLKRFAFVALLLSTLSSAHAQSNFYQGKHILLIVGSGPGGVGDMRARALAAGLTRNIPGNPPIVFQYMPGAGGRRATNHIFNNVKPDGLTLLRVSSSVIPYAVLGESGVQYDIDKLNYLGATEHQLYYSFVTRKGAGISNLEKLRSTPGVRMGSSPVGHTGYLHSRAIAYLLDMKDPRIVPGYESADLDIAFAKNEVDARVASTVTVSQQELLTKNLADFHLAIEVPRGYKDPRFAQLRLPDITSFVKSERERKLLTMMEGFRVVGTMLLAPPGTPKDRLDILTEAVRKTNSDPQFAADYKRLTGGDDPTPLNPEDQAKIVRDIPRDPEIIELFKKFAGTAPLPAR